MESDATDKVLDIVESIDRKLDEKSRSDEARFMAAEALIRDHENRLDGHEEKLTDHDERLRSHDILLRDQAQLLTSLGHSTARAVDTALDAKRIASQSVDEATKIVESAIKMHSASIALTVQSAVKAELAPLTSKVETIERSDEAQTTAIEEQTKSIAKMTTMLTGVVKSLGHPKLRILLLLCACIGAVAGGAYSAFVAKEAVDAATPHKSALPR